MTVTATMVRDLRDKTGAGMMDCKKALNETNGDMEAAIDWLRAKGIASAAKKASRTAAEGLIGVYTQGHKGAVVEVNAETDFVAMNDKFQSYVRETVCKAVAHEGHFDAFPGSAFNAERSVEEELTHLISIIGENMVLRRYAMLDVSPGVVVGYVHAPIAPDLGRIGVLVALESEGDKEALQGLGKQIAMHIAAARPVSLTIENLDPALVAREEAIAAERAQESGKPEAVIEKMVQGRLRKFYEEVVLLEQTFVIDGESKLKDVLKQAEKTCGAPVTLAGYYRFELGEGIEKKADDFAAEVASLTK